MEADKVTDAQLFKTTAAAMAPYRCVAEFSDYGARYGFAVYYGDEDHERQVFEYPRREVRRARDLIVALNDARQRMSAIGVNFQPWDNKIYD
jgi:peptide methionine sulfoxide reductase MsrA